MKTSVTVWTGILQKTSRSPEARHSLTFASGQLNTSWLVTEDTRQKRLHLVVLMCMMGDPGSPSLLHLMPEVRAQRHAGFSGSKDDDDSEEEGGNREDRWSVAFPSVTGEQEVMDSLEWEMRWRKVAACPLLSSHRSAWAVLRSPQSTHCLLTHIPTLSSHLLQTHQPVFLLNVGEWALQPAN